MTPQRVQLSTLQNTPMFFIVGMGRSGTTLLRSLFDSHPNIVCLPESNIMLFLRHKYSSKKLVVADVPMIFKHIAMDRKIQGFWHLNLEELRRNMEACIAEGATFNDLCKLIYLHHHKTIEKTDLSYIGDKNPIYSRWVSWISKQFPDAKFIHIIRDYRDCVASHNRVFKKRPTGTVAHGWIRYNKGIEAVKQKHPERFITVRYEDLVNGPDEQAARLCHFLGIEPHPAMFTYHEWYNEHRNRLNYKALEHAHGELAKPVHNQNIGKYKKTLSEKNVRIIEYVCAQKGLEYGYTPTLNIKRTPGLAIKSAFNGLYFRWNDFVIRRYYNTPFFVRKIARGIMEFMFRAFKITNVYNNAELAHRKNNPSANPGVNEQ